MLRGRRTLIVLILIGVLFVGATITVRWLLRPENLTRVITGWVERELGASLTLADAPGVRLVPRLQLSLDGVRLERNGALLASAEELRVALPWSALWRDTLAMESLSLRRPVIAWPQLTTLLDELSDPDRPSRVPALPQLAVGMRVEEGTLLSGDSDNAEAWRIDQISLVTTPLLTGEVFHLDAGARIQDGEQRTVSLSLQARPTNRSDSLTIEDAAMRVVISPADLPLSQGMTIELNGSTRIDADGLAEASLAGRLPGWPDWLPNTFGFEQTQPIALDIALPANAGELTLALSQHQHRLDARLQADDIDDAFKRIAQPLHALANLRSQWRLDALSFGNVRVEGIEIDVAPAPTEPAAPAPDDAENGNGNSGRH